MDIFCLVVICINSVTGFVKGFVKMLFSLLGVLVIGFIAYKLVSVVAATSVGEWVYGLLHGSIQGSLDGLVPGEFASIDEFLAALSAQNVSAIVISIIKFALRGVEISSAFTCGGLVADMVTKYIANIVIFLVLFLGLSLVIKIVRIIIEKIVKKVGLKFANRVFGLLFGAVKGVLICALIFFILTSISPVLPFLKDVLESGPVSSMFYNNVFVHFFNWLSNVFA